MVFVISSHSHSIIFLGGFQDANYGTNTFSHRIDVADILLNHRIGRQSPNHIIVEAIGITAALIFRIFAEVKLMSTTSKVLGF